MNPKKRRPWNFGTHGLTGRKRTGETRVCRCCRDAFYTCRSAIVRSDPRYCSARCYFKARWGNGHQEIRACVMCKRTFIEQKATTRVCCSEACRRLRFSTSRRGVNSHFWRGGKTRPYIGTWQTQRRKALLRDGDLCVTCGGDDRIQVHHVSPFRYSRSHALRNLKTLCRSCHSREEYAVNLVRKDQLNAARDRRAIASPASAAFR